MHPLDTRLIRGLPALEDARRFRAAAIARESGFRPGDDVFDEHGDVLAAVDTGTGEIAGSCRVMSPADARRAGRNELDRRFDTALLIVLRERMVEIDTPQVHPLYRYEDVMAQLWSAVARYLIDHRLDYVLGAARVSMLDGGHAAASIHRIALARHLSPDDMRVHPRHDLDLWGLADSRSVTFPPLMRSYLEMGAWVCGAPAHRPEVAAAEFPMLMPLARMREREARRFLARAL